MKKIILLGLVVFFVTGCVIQRGADGKPGENGKPGRQAKWEILSEGSMGGHDTESITVIKTQQELDRLYSELNLAGSTPKVDFNTKNVVALYMGQRNTGGYAITIEDVIVKGDTAIVVPKHIRPAPDGMVTMAITNPYCIAAIQKTTTVDFYLLDPPVIDKN